MSRVRSLVCVGLISACSAVTSQAAIADSVGRDLVVDFGRSGLWEFLDNSEWKKINDRSPMAVSVGDLDGDGTDDAVGSFSRIGLWVRYNNSATWAKIHNSTARLVVSGDLDGNGKDDLVVDFGKTGIWVRYNDNPSWKKLHQGTSQILAVGDFDGGGMSDLLVDFGKAGLWEMLNNSTWKRIHRSSPIALATGDLDGNGKAEVIASYAKAGLWVRYNNSASWTRLHLYTPSNFFAGDLDGSGEDELVVDFGDSGLWARFNDASWQKLHSASPSEATAADLDGNGEVEAVVSFGKAGLWAWYNNANWRKVSGARVQIIQAGTFKTSNSSPAPTASLTSDPTVIDLGDSSTLVWQSADADSCTGVGFSTGGSANGSVMVSPTADASYSVSCTGEGGTANASATVSVNQPEDPPPPTASLTANPTVIDLGDSSALAWQSTDADSCTGVGFSTGGSANGSVMVSPTADASYSVSCTGEGGTANASATVSVNQPPSPTAPTASLTADPTVIDLGDSSALAWQSTDADSCTGVGFSTGGGANGSVTVSPTADASYSVSCTGEGGTASASATVSVNQPPPGEQVWPNADNTGVPAGWQPAQTLNSTLTISQNGAVVQDIRITTGDLRIQADNVTVRRVELLDGRITNDSCHDNLLIEDTSVMGHTSSEGAISPGSYTARRVRLDGVPEGFRVGAKPACGAVWVEDSFVHVTPPSPCGDWHGDGLQGYGGPPLVIRNVTIDFQEGGGCYGTAPFFYPADQGNTSVDVDRLIVRGGGFSFRLGMPGRVRNLRVVNRSWGYGPIEVNCSALSDWSAEIVTIDSDYQPTGTVSNLACN